MGDHANGWYYMERNWRGHSFVRGPFSAGELLILLEKGEINRKTQVRGGPNSFWYPLDDVFPLLTTLTKQAAPRTVRPAFRKKYKPAFLIALLIAGCIVVGRYASDWPSVSRQSYLSTGNADTAQNTARFGRQYPGQEVLSRETVVNLTNNARALNGLATLSRNQLLDAVAEERAKDMLEKQYFAHTSPTGEQASDVAQKVGYRYKIIAENIASGMFLTNQKIIDGWMQSPGHRKNILSPEVREIGVSVIKGRMNSQDTWISVQIFGLQSLPVPEQSCVHPSRQLMNEIEVKRAELKHLDDRLTTLKGELEAEKTSIELDRMDAGSDRKSNHDLNVKIAAYNAKTNWYNQSLADMKGKQAVLNSMVEEYNRMLQNYKDCQGSN